MALDDSERGAGSGDIAASSSNQGTEPGWPRVFHCDLNEQAELPLLAEPRLGAEQVGGLYAGEEITAVGQQGDWLHVRLYEEDEDEDNDVRAHLFLVVFALTHAARACVCTPRPASRGS